MNASSPQQSPAEPFDDYDDGFDEVLPARPRARYLTPLTALLMALILGGVGFYVGIRVEKSQGASTGGALRVRAVPSPACDRLHRAAGPAARRAPASRAARAASPRALPARSGGAGGGNRSAPSRA